MPGPASHPLATRLIAAASAGLSVAALSASPALAAAGSKHAQPVSVANPTATGCVPSTEPPRFVFVEGPGGAATSGTLTLFATIQGCRVSVSGRAGSGVLGETNDCAAGRGPAPVGGYQIRRFFAKNGGSGVVRGRVWHLSDRRCANGSTVRSALFIHSSGPEGTAFTGDYQSNGCVKTDQAARSVFADYFTRATRQGDATLVVLPALGAKGDL